MSKKLQIVGSVINTDTNLTQSGVAADAKAVGDAIKLKADKTEVVQAVNDALAQAKTSGEFDGSDGYSPVRGTDYWTDADKAEIKSYVDEAILGGAW